MIGKCVYELKTVKKHNPYSIYTTFTSKGPFRKDSPWMVIISFPPRHDHFIPTNAFSCRKILKKTYIPITMYTSLRASDIDNHIPLCAWLCCRQLQRRPSGKVPFVLDVFMNNAEKPRLVDESQGVFYVWLCQRSSTYCLQKNAGIHKLCLSECHSRL